MPRRGRIDQLDRMLEAILADRGDPRPPADQQLTELLRIAQELRELPRPAFRARLGADLSRRATMTTATGTPAPDTIQTLTVYLAVRPAAELIEFVKRAFGAEELVRTTGSGGGLHAEVRIGDTTVMIGGGDAWGGTPTPTALHLYVADADAVYRRALEAGATSRRPPVDQPYGDREASVTDLAGNSWYIATHQTGGHVPPGLRSVTPYLHPRGSDQVIDFLRRAFGATEMEIERKPDGTVAHAKVQVGGSVIEMGEAHAEFQPMPAMFYLYVDDVDAAYRRALAAGATSREEPAVQPYGERRAAVRDPFDNQWYIATPAR
ncbi:MAG TPA: VOC family protein [Candidatus Methylomirabilis sp.]|nr:VOC family protein [Candidatus Methylomirabilis sp.]